MKSTETAKENSMATRTERQCRICGTWKEMNVGFLNTAHLYCIDCDEIIDLKYGDLPEIATWKEEMRSKWNFVFRKPLPDRAIVYGSPNHFMNFQELFSLGMDRHLDQLIPQGEVALNLGAGNKHIRGARSIDYPEWDADKEAIPAKNNSVDTIYMLHFLEHVKEPVEVLIECQRVLKVGGTINIVVPYGASQLAIQDLDHKNFFNEETWKTLFRNPYYDKNRIAWELEVKLNLICGIVGRNLCLMTQILRTK